MTLRPWVLAMVLWAPVLAWSRPFEVCGVRVTIGDQRAVLEAAMSAGCRITTTTEHPEASSFRSRHPDQADEPAVIFYRDERVVSATLPPLKFRAKDDPGVLARVLAEAMQNASDDVGPPVRVSTRTTGRPHVGTTTLVVVFKGRVVELWAQDRFDPTGYKAILSQTLRADETD
ncbi:hypothetical protein [Rhizobacter sp. Root1221]|uniref:hypothetical protein n=1 Tax=Rhizobacter sp. Root1221 TaxID=1736433 RepID=UPI0006F38E0A|nr:hypothetical protein [Rhizobacter sp. Root1221]KQV78339.1 hypothetical protein ASC87_12165 [Rhizobacter sp. Root1221]